MEILGGLYSIPPIFRKACPHVLDVDSGYFSQGYAATPLQAVRVPL